MKKSDSEYPPVFARFYDLIYDHIRTHVDHEFYLKSILECNGSVLEIGSGTGRLFRDALYKEADIYGIDISPAMLEVLKSKIPEKDHHRVSCQSITDFHIQKKFNLVVAPFRVFMHLTEVADQFEALNQVEKHLAKDGLFIFDVFVPNPKYLSEKEISFMDFEGEYKPGNVFRRFTTASYDLINQLIQICFKFEWNENENLYNDSWESTLRFFWKYELEHLVAGSNLKITAIYGDFNKKDLSPDSQDFIVVCKRKKD